VTQAVGLQEQEGTFRRIAGILSSSPAQSQSVDIGPNWFASVMGTGIIANAAVTLPVVGPSLRGFSLVIWVAAALLLLVLIVASGVQWIRRPHLVRAHARDPMMAQFYGAPPMAMMTVGTGALLVGDSLVGSDAAVTIAWVLWVLGTIGGLVTAAAVPFRLFTLYEVRPDAAFGGWLMPVVPPMVSATAGALLVPYVPEGTSRETMLYGCYAMFGMSLVASLIIISMIWSRLAHYGSSGTARVPTLWIVLGPIGQSITAAGLLGTAAAIAVAPQIASAMNVFAILGFRDLVGGHCRAYHDQDSSAQAALRADVVELRIPRRHLRHGHDAIGQAHRIAGVWVGGGAGVRCAVVCVDPRRGTDLARQSESESTQPSASRRTDRLVQGVKVGDWELVRLTEQSEARPAW